MSKIEKRIIKFLSDYPEREFYAQEISQKIGCSKASANNILKDLSNSKIVRKKVKGHMKFYQIDSENPEVKKNRIGFVLEEMGRILPELEKHSQKIVLFGSGSRGEQTAKSDIDVLILTQEKDSIGEILAKTKPSLPIRAIVKTPSEWSEMEVRDPEFYREVETGITLHNYVTRNMEEDERD
jgi:predicted nucleotidyltransferase